MIAAIIYQLQKQFFSCQIWKCFKVQGDHTSLFKKLSNEKAKFLPITDKRMTRFLITLDQAYDFVCIKLRT